MALQNIKKYKNAEYMAYIFEQKWKTIENKLALAKKTAKLKFTQGLNDDINKKIVETIDFLNLFGAPIEPVQEYIVSEKEFNSKKNREIQEEYRKMWIDSKDPEWK